MAASNHNPSSPSQKLAQLASQAGTQIPGQSSGRETATEALIFLRVARRWFAVASSCVREVGTKGFVTRVPTAPAHVLGVTLVRGRLVPILALEGLVGDMGAGEAAQTLPRLVVLRHQDTEIALVADETRGVIERRIEIADAAEHAARVSAGRPRFLGAEFEWEGKLVCMLEVPALIEAAAPRAEQT